MRNQEVILIRCVADTTYRDKWYVIGDVLMLTVNQWMMLDRHYWEAVTSYTASDSVIHRGVY